MKQSEIEAEAVAGAACPACGAPLPDGCTPLAKMACPACGAVIMVPGKLGQYRLTRLIGAGGMGAVYEGFDDGLQRKVAVKVILREKAAEDPSFIESFKHEAQAAAKLNSANIVGVYAFGESAGQPYLVMELVQPDSLDRMMNQGPVAPKVALDVGRQIAQGLRAAAEQGLVHGDVKPENILINEAREAKLADFGIAALAGAKAAAENTVWGTPYYIAPETLRKQKVDLRADIYSLGATLYHAIAGVPPFEGADAVEVMKGRLLGPARPLTDVAPSCPEAVAKIVMRMLEAEPIRRYPNYESLLADIEKILPASRGHATNKKIAIKGKTQALKSATGPSQPMLSVENPNAPLFPEKKKGSGGMSKGALIGLAVGIPLAVLALIGGLIAFLVSQAKSGLEQAAGELSAAMEQVDLTAQAAAAEASAREGALGSLRKVADEAAKLAQQAKSDAATAATIVKQLAQQAKRAVLPEDMRWLEPVESAPATEGQPAETPPTSLLKAMQEAFGHQRVLGVAEKLAEALRVKVDALATSAAEGDASAAQGALQEAEAALAAYRREPAVKEAPKRLSALKAAQANWRRTVDRGRTEMEAQVAAKREAERKEKAAAAAAAEAERKQQAIAAEVSAVAAAERAINSELDRFLPEAALEGFKARTARYKSPEAKEAAERVQEKIAAFARLKTWLIKQAGAGKLAGFGVLAADKDGVSMKNGKTLPWRDFVGNQQVVAFRIFSTLIIDDSAGRDLKVSERAELAVSTRLYIARFFGEEAVSKSKALRDGMEKCKALAEALPGPRAELERLERVDD